MVEVVAKAWRASATGYYAQVAERAGRVGEASQGVSLEAAEGGFALLGENFAYRHAGSFLDCLVEVDKVSHARTLQGAAKCRFTRAWQANQKDGLPLGGVCVSR